MHQCEIHNKDGLLMLTDSEKAFVSVSWTFLCKILEFFTLAKTL